MRAIPLKMRREMAEDAYYKHCARKSNECSGRITFEHALIYAGRQVNEYWAILPLCVYHHLGPGLNKDINVWIALERATLTDLAYYPRSDWFARRLSLIRKYGHYKPFIECKIAYA